MVELDTVRREGRSVNLFIRGGDQIAKNAMKQNNPLSIRTTIDGENGSTERMKRRLPAYVAHHG